MHVISLLETRTKGSYQEMLAGVSTSVLSFNNPSVKGGKCSGAGRLASCGQNNWLIVRHFYLSVHPSGAWRQWISTNSAGASLESSCKLCPILWSYPQSRVNFVKNKNKKEWNDCEVEIWHLPRALLSKTRSHKGITTRKHYLSPKKWDHSGLLISPYTSDFWSFCKGTETCFYTKNMYMKKAPSDFKRIKIVHRIWKTAWKTTEKSEIWSTSRSVLWVRKVHSEIVR